MNKARDEPYNGDVGKAPENFPQHNSGKTTELGKALHKMKVTEQNESKSVSPTRFEIPNDFSQLGKDKKGEYLNKHKNERGFLNVKLAEIAEKDRRKEENRQETEDVRVGKVNLLTQELLVEIFSYFTPTELRTASIINHAWKDAAARHLWKRMVFPLDKRQLGAMRGILTTYGRYIRKALIVPPIEILTASTLSTGGHSIPVVGSSAEEKSTWSIPRPLSRSGSASSMSCLLHQSPRLSFTNQTGSHRIDSRGSEQHLSDITENNLDGYLLGNDELDIGLDINATKGCKPDFTVSEHSSYASTSGISILESNLHNFSDANCSAIDSDASSIITDVGSIVRPTTPPNVPFFTENYNREHNGGVLGRGRASLPTVSQLGIGTPVPGTPGVGNMLEGDYDPPFNGSDAPTRASSLGGYPRSTGSQFSLIRSVSSGTVRRLQQFMESYCPLINDLTVLNPNGITNHGRRIELLKLLFDTYPNLTRLNLTDFIMWDVEAMKLVSTCLPNLRSLNVTNRVELRDEDLVPVIQNCVHLESLKIRATNISDKTIAALEKHTSPRLRLLDIGGCAVSSTAMASLLKKTPKLRELRAWSCLRLNDEFLIHLDPQFLPNLSILDLKDVGYFSEDVVSAVFALQSWPNLKYLRIRAKCGLSSFSGLPKAATVKLNSDYKME
ncbi:F-box/LRR-repeat protein 20 [Zancudomyces culisetae]|uniref:F-box/LRR-repeat protein 20 n=1 Tax=Zancudomyces culisetae TaxID=1213189 RepID=A0A1R1PIV7_ZANCU|nr:F-box/LRR-repeat protein 20 [Zancudomyces culisetae]|eukprot:OMH80945.1 F-box/LRR-repeat protein 20 [Zancudomyces culisetae]